MFLEFILFGFGLLIALRQYNTIKNSKANFSRLAAAGYFDNEDRQLEALSIAKTIVRTNSNLPSRKFKRAFLFIGGFGDAPELWESVIKSSSNQDDDTFCYAPRTLGWGRSNFDEARRVKWQDWVLAALEALAVVSALANEVVVVAHSTGALVAAFLLQRASPGQISRCIFTGPNIVSPPQDEALKKLLLHPIIGRIIIAMSPIHPKKLRNNRPVDVKNWQSSSYYLTSFPLHTVREMWRMQEALAQSTDMWVGVKHEVVLMMGEEDLSVAPLQNSVDFTKKFVPNSVNVKPILVKNAAHGLTWETPDVVQQVCNAVFKSEYSSPSH